ncbi:MAG: acetolactate synthase small subunit [Candidatus Omnitrophica bacterium 4484_70.2]|nr:MAG: acetolactate synthase small subunit [Candidatus Omnitrophica bacterium 4484_70.2]
MKHTIQALVENRFGVLARIASLFSARGFNIDSLAVGETQDPSISCMTIVVNAEDEIILDQIKKQLRKLIDVITVVDLTKREYIERELILLKVYIKNKKKQEEIKEIFKKYQVSILEKEKDYLIVQIVGNQHDIQNFLNAVKKFGIKELVRTGRIAITK